VFGTGFKSNKNITCTFGNQTTVGKYIDESKLKCWSPATDTPGFVPLSVAYEGDKYSSTAV
jgi:hypothetical protein